MTTARYTRLRGLAQAAEIRTARYDGAEHLVVPVVAMVGDSVLRPLGSEGPEYVPAEVLAVAPETWNDRVVLEDHPLDGGAPISANRPEILESQGFGRVFNARYEDRRLKVEAWINPERVERAGEKAQRVLARLRALADGETEELVEVSVGAYVMLEKRSGTAPDGKHYDYVWLQALPDHLAVGLGGSKGACSAEAGCGAPRAAKDGEPPRAALRAAALSQARRPTFTGTETSAWSTPSWSDWTRYLHEASEGPGSVRQAPAALKRRVAGHTLLGDPEASTLRDLTLFPVVNPANGNLNENALRAVLGGRGAQADISDRARESAQDMARRLLNSEFGAELEVSKVRAAYDPSQPRDKDGKFSSGGFATNAEVDAALAAGEIDEAMGAGDYLGSPVYDEGNKSLRWEGFRTEDGSDLEINGRETASDVQGKASFVSEAARKERIGVSELSANNYLTKRWHEARKTNRLPKMKEPPSRKSELKEPAARGRRGSVMHSAAESENLQQWLRDALEDTESGYEYLWVESFDTEAGTVVYVLRGEDGETSGTYRRSYSLDGEAVTVGEERTEVRRRVVYEDAPAAEVSAARLQLPPMLVKALAAIGYRPAQGADGHSDVEVREAIWKALNSAVPAFYGVAEIYHETSTVIYATTPDDGDLKWWRRTYEIEEDGSVGLNDDAAEVEIEKSWKPVQARLQFDAAEGEKPPCGCNEENGEGQAAPSQDDQGGRMTNEMKQLVGRLIASKHCRYGEDDRATLEAMSEDRLKALSEALPDDNPEGEQKPAAGEEGKEPEKAAAPAEPEKASEPKVAAEEKPAAPAKDPAPAEDKSVKVPLEVFEDMKAASAAWKSEQARKRDSLVKALAKAQDGFTAEDLKALTMEQLGKLARSHKIGEPEPAPDYSGRALAEPPEGARHEPPDSYAAVIAAKRAKLGYAAEKEAN